MIFICELRQIQRISILIISAGKIPVNGDVTFVLLSKNGEYAPEYAPQTPLLEWGKHPISCGKAKVFHIIHRLIHRGQGTWKRVDYAMGGLHNSTWRNSTDSALFPL